MAASWSPAISSQIGIEPGKSFEWDKLDPAVQESLTKAAAFALKAMYMKTPTLAKVVDGWQMNTDTMGVYGNYYLKRAIVAMIGLGANQPDDAIYPLNVGDVDGQPLRAENSYVLHFIKEQLPPAEAFWSLTMYDADGFQVPNPINRFAIGDRDKLKFNADGSLDLYIQHENPGAEREPNWLPAREKGRAGDYDANLRSETGRMLRKVGASRSAESQREYGRTAKVVRAFPSIPPALGGGLG